MIKQYEKAGVLILLLLTFLIIQVNAQEIETLNSATMETASMISYRIVEISPYVDSTYNTYYLLVKNKSFVDIEFRNKQKFDIWDYEVSINGTQHKFIPRPQVGDPIERTENQYFFEDRIPLNEAAEQPIKITFWMSNIKDLRKRWFFPFDKYKVFLLDTDIQDKSTDIAKIISKKEDMLITPVTTSGRVSITCGNKILNQPMEIKHNPIETRDMIMTSEMGRMNCTLSGITITGYGCNPCVQNLTQNTEIEINRALFPSILLFFLLGFYAIFITIYNFWVNKNFKTMWEKYHEIYAKLLIPLVIVEFTISFSPPWRPLGFTIFDSIILWPLIPLLVYYFKKIPYKKIKDRISYVFHKLFSPKLLVSPIPPNIK